MDILSTARRARSSRRGDADGARDRAINRTQDGLRAAKLIASRQELENDASLKMRIGLISDTHGLLRPEAKQWLAGVSHIVHAGDIGRPEVVAALGQIAPVTAIKGNIDAADWAASYPDTRLVRLGGRCIYVLHDLNELQINPVALGVDVVVSGHSHRPRIETIDGIMYLNPGSAGPRRFNLPVSLATLDITATGLVPAIHDLTKTE